MGNTTEGKEEAKEKEEEMVGGESLGFWSMVSMLFGCVVLLGTFGGILLGL